jgi:EAL domain-containing protein (putative c-di-GMP-specific phosphodiesterase class I)
MAYLDSFPISTLKIDRSFVAEVDGDAAKKEIVGAILLLAQSLNLDVIGEGVETKSQRQVLEQMGCKFGQGWLFSKALPPDQIPAWIDENRTHS